MTLPTYLSGERIQGKTTDTLTSITAAPLTGWKVVARAILTSNASVMDTGTGNGTTSGCVVTENTMYATPREKYMVLVRVLWTSDPVQTKLQVRKTDGSIDTGNNYANRYSRDMQAQSANASDPLMFKLSDGTDNSDEFGVFHISNYVAGGSGYAEGHNKLGFGTSMNAEVSSDGASNSPHIVYAIGGYKEYNETIKGIVVTNISGNDFKIGSEIIVLGLDDDEANSGDVFWDELDVAKVTSGTATSLEVEFTAKKYLWVESLIVPTGAHVIDWTFSDAGGDLTTGYCWRTSNGIRGNSSSTQNTDDCGVVHPNASGANLSFTNTYISNPNGYIKMGIAQTVGATAGTAIRPTRQVLVFSQSDTDQITKIKINTTSNAYGVGSVLRVWGHD